MCAFYTIYIYIINLILHEVYNMRREREKKRRGFFFVCLYFLFTQFNVLLLLLSYKFINVMKQKQKKTKGSQNPILPCFLIISLLFIHLMPAFLGKKISSFCPLF